MMFRARRQERSALPQRVADIDLQGEFSSTLSGGIRSKGNRFSGIRSEGNRSKGNRSINHSLQKHSFQRFSLQRLTPSALQLRQHDVPSPFLPYPRRSDPPSPSLTSPSPFAIAPTPPYTSLTQLPDSLRSSGKQKKLGSIRFGPSPLSSVVVVRGHCLTDSSQFAPSQLTKHSSDLYCCVSECKIILMLTV